jgi:hypothetical protein
MHTVMSAHGEPLLYSSLACSAWMEEVQHAYIRDSLEGAYSERDAITNKWRNFSPLDQIYTSLSKAFKVLPHDKPIPTLRSQLRYPYQSQGDAVITKLRPFGEQTCRTFEWPYVSIIATAWTTNNVGLQAGRAYDQRPQPPTGHLLSSAKRAGQVCDHAAAKAAVVA